MSDVNAEITSAVFLTFIISSLSWALLWALVTLGNKKDNDE